MSFKSNCDFNEFDEKRADFIYQNAIDLWKSLEESIQHIKRNAVVLLGYLLGSSSLLINLFFNSNAEKYQMPILILIVIHLLISIYITCKIFLPKNRILPFLSPKDLLRYDFNYNESKMIELPKWKLKILQDIVDSDIETISNIEQSLADVFKNSIFLTIFAPLASIAIAIKIILFYCSSSLFCCLL